MDSKELNRIISEQKRKELAHPTEMSESFKQVREAVVNKRCLVALYDGNGRLFSPIEIGWNKDNVEQVFIWQFGGYSGGQDVTKENAVYRLLNIAKLSQLTQVDDSWDEGPGYPGSRIAKIHR